ncbi:hypothetical protein N8920_02665 [Opitutales bacterium]|nr:hypothetical protein [Opitutales bacterium]MDA8990275.1 hypothetical protein [Opitutales bacterium]
MPSKKRPKASTIGTPIYHRKRRNWEDDRNLLTELAGVVSKIDGPYDYFAPNSKGFSNKIDAIKQKGFEENPDAYFLAMWVREKLSDLLIQQGSYNLLIHPLQLPDDIEKVIKLEEKKVTKGGHDGKTNISLATLFPNPRLRAFALERVQMLHRGDLIAYLSSLVARERESLMSSSASIMDLIHICEHKLNLRKLSIKKRFSVGETDLWVPSLSLGVEVRDTWNTNEEIKIIRVLSDTNFRLQASNLCLVTPDDLSDEAFLKLREIEKRGVIENLSVIRIGDFGSYLDQLMTDQNI